MTLDKESVERLLLNRPNAKSKEERDEYDDIYHEMRRQLAIERARRDDRDTARSGRKPRLSPRGPVYPPSWPPTGE